MYKKVFRNSTNGFVTNVVSVSIYFQTASSSNLCLGEQTQELTNHLDLH